MLIEMRMYILSAFVCKAILCRLVHPGGVSGEFAFRSPSTPDR
jgi:hypothetical protein